MDSLEACHEALVALDYKYGKGEIDLNTFWCEAEVICDRARGIQQGL